MNKKKTNGFSLYKLIITVVIIYLVISSVKALFSSNDEYQEDINNYSTNNYIGNHTVSYDEDTSSNDVNYETTDGVREKFTTIKGDNQDDVTLMVYMIGTDLESQYGMATSDINEMLYAGIDGNINIVLQTGGCSKWKNSVISNKTIERYTINANGLSKLQGNVGNESMTNPTVLTSFIKYSAANFPANRYMLILWDHGGGSATGYGYDEKFPQTSMSPDLIGQAIGNSGIKFDFVGFDACLMANLETAIALEPYADYLIGSEETEPGTGWYYTNFVKELDKNTSISTLNLSKAIIDDYVSNSKKSDRNAEVTLSVTDLGELVYGIKKPLQDFSKATIEKLESSDYQKIATARYNTKEFSKQSRLDQVDLVDLADNFNVEGSKELITAVKSAVKYNKTYNITDSYGMSIYFPYSSLSTVNSMVKIYNNINMDNYYSSVVKSFATYASSGQIVTQNSGSTGSSIFDVLLGNGYGYTDDSYYSNDNVYDVLSDSYYGGNNYGYGYQDSLGGGYDEWMEPSMLDVMSLFFRSNKLVDTKGLNVLEKNNQRLVSLTNEQWDLINNVTLNMFIDDGGGYIDLGKDNTFEFNNDGELIVDSDGTWLSVNDHVVAYYLISDTYISDDNYKTVGVIPAYLNNQRVNLIVNFTPENPYGIILGAKIDYDYDIEQKGLVEIKEGDEINFICNYYSYNGEFIDEYQIGDPFIVDKELELNNIYLDNDYVYTYCFEDIYGNNLYTPKTVIKK